MRPAKSSERGWGRAGTADRPLISALLWLLTSLLACAVARGGWDVSALDQRYPALSALGPHRLGDVAPHFLPDADGAALFLCRWSTAAPIGVSLPPDASEAELRAIRVSLAAWSKAGLGVDFVEAESARVRLEIRFGEAAEAGAPAGTGDTIADCAIGADLAAPPASGRVAAEMSFASIQLRRGARDMLGREVALSPDERVGALLHELGHALGFSGHVAVGASVMRRSPEHVRRVGRAVNRGEPFGDAGLSALYAVPSGVVVGRLAVSPEQRQRLRRVARLASESGWRGPYTRVGDSSARIVWRDARGRSLALEAAGWHRVVRGSGSAVFEPSPRARRLLESGGPIRR